MAPVAEDVRHPPADRHTSCLHPTSLVPSCVSIRHASLRTSMSCRLHVPSSPLVFFVSRLLCFSPVLRSSGPQLILSGLLVLSGSSGTLPSPPSSPAPNSAPSPTTGPGRPFSAAGRQIPPGTRRALPPVQRDPRPSARRCGRHRAATPGMMPLRGKPPLAAGRANERGRRRHTALRPSPSLERAASPPEPAANLVPIGHAFRHGLAGQSHLVRLATQRRIGDRRAPRLCTHSGGERAAPGPMRTSRRAPPDDTAVSGRLF